MRLFHSARWLLLAALLLILPATSFAGVFISVAVAPPVLPVYEQPLCPESGWMWIPGYWAYGDDGYYWVPGTWVPAPYEGALWTPGYWGWTDGFYIWHPGYWGDHVGYYGGVNYGFGYMGIGFVGGMWRNHDFVYNTAIMRVDERRVHNVYVDRTIIQRNTIVNDRRVAFSGGRGGINHSPTAQERIANRDRHTVATSFQTQHEMAAKGDRNSYFRNNNGRPSSMAVSRPMGSDSRTTPGNNMRQGQQNRFNTNSGSQSQPSRQTQQMNQNQPTMQNRQPAQNQMRQSQPSRQMQQSTQSEPTMQTRQPVQNQTRQTNQTQPTRQSQQPSAQPTRQQQSRPSDASKSERRDGQRDKHEKENRDHNKE
jgi:hypothetical protein